MPIYSYRCTACEAEFELLVRISSESAPSCPDCGSPEIKQLVSRVAPPGKSAGLIAAGRAQAAKEGHFSHYSKAERKGMLKPS